MSGGSYEYLFVKDVDQLLNAESLIKAMFERLAGLGYAEDAAKETFDLLLTLRQFRVRIEVMQGRLSEVWRAIEWWDSGDSGEDGFKEALDSYRLKTK